MGYSGKVKKHSKAGKEYLQYGEKGFEELSKTRQKTARLKKKVAAVGVAPHDPTETKTQKERGGYIGPSKGSSGSSMKPTIQEWMKTRRYKGGVTHRKTIEYGRAMKRWQPSQR